MKLDLSAPVVMALHPAYRGFGWTVFQGPSAPIDWGLTYARGGDREAAYRRHLETLLVRHRPEVLVLEAQVPDPARPSRTGARRQQSAATLAGVQGVEVCFYDRSTVHEALGLLATATRDQVAGAVAEHIGAFRHRLPPERRPWEAADRRLALFMAAALALTHYAQDDEPRWVVDPQQV